MAGSGRKRSSGGNLIISSSILALAQIIVRFIGLFYRVPLQHIVGDEGVGYYGFTFQIYQVILLLSANAIPIAVSLLVSKNLASRQYKNVWRIFKGSLVFAAIVGGLFSLLVLFGAKGLAVALFNQPNVAPSLRVIAPAIFVAAVMGVFRGFFQGKGAMLPTAISQIIEQIFNAVISVVAAYLLIVKGPAYGAAGSTLGTLTGALAGLVFVMIVFWAYKPTLMRVVRRDKDSKEDKYGHIIRVVSLTMAPIILSSTIYQISGIVDSTLYSKILYHLGYDPAVTASLYGIYTGQYQVIFNVPLGIASSIGIALVPMITRAVVKGDIANINAKISSVLRLTMIIALPCAVGLAALATPIMQMLFGANTSVSISLLRLGGVAIVLYSFSTVTIALLQGLNKLHAPVIDAAIALAVHIVFMVVLLVFCDMNIYSLIYGNAIFAFVMCVLNLRSLKKATGYVQEYLKTLIIPLVVSLIMGGITYFVYKGLYYVMHRNLIPTIIAIIVGVVVYGIVIVVFGGVDEEELLYIPKGRFFVKIFKKFKVM
ncbi:MAG: polysaccharide biosynthesis protein [Lachnospiraceae bacterium]|nr:polysaccharide biosynthesis protein [Lachnospiraceae bacterium]